MAENLLEESEDVWRERIVFHASDSVVETTGERSKYYKGQITNEE